MINDMSYQENRTGDGLDARAFLIAHGLRIDPGELDQMVVRALETLPRTLYGDANRELSEADREVLEAGAADLEVRYDEGNDPLAEAIAETAALLRTSLTTAEAAARLEVDVSRIRQRLADRTLFGLRHGNTWLIPSFQLDGDRLVPGIDEVLPHLDPEIHLLALFRWFTLPSPDLQLDGEGDVQRQNLSPRQWLLLGLGVDPVLEAAGSLRRYIDNAEQASPIPRPATESTQPGEVRESPPETNDLAIIKGVGGEYGDLLAAAGVDTLRQLATSDPERLSSNMERINRLGETRICKRTPGPSTVAKWVAQARRLIPARGD
jgi:predicted flap endonuclease-1-like 5' DNA nuclease